MEAKAKNVNQHEQARIVPLNLWINTGKVQKNAIPSRAPPEMMLVKRVSRKCAGNSQPDNLR